MKKVFELLKRPNTYWVLFLLVLVIIGISVQSQYTLDIWISILYFAAMAASWNLVGGFAGQISLGHVAFTGLGGYTSTILFLKLGITPWIGMFLGGGVAMLLASVMGLLTIRLRGPFFTLSSIALAEILMIFTIRLDKLTNGSEGLNIPYIPSFVNLVFKSYRVYFFIFLTLMALVIATTIYIKNSKIGYNLVAVREDEVAAASLGVNVTRSKLVALLVSAFFCGIGGALHANYLLFIDPHSAFAVGFSTKITALSIIGGIGTVAGPIVGAFLLTPLEIWLRSSLGSTYQGLYLLVYGIVMVFVMLVIPQGLVGAFQSLATQIKKRIKS